VSGYGSTTSQHDSGAKMLRLAASHRPSVA
jgi:hypothetical protein